MPRDSQLALGPAARIRFCVCETWITRPMPLKRTRVHYRRLYRTSDPAIGMPLAFAVAAALQHTVDGSQLDRAVAPHRSFRSLTPGLSPFSSLSEAPAVQV